MAGVVLALAATGIYLWQATGRECKPRLAVRWPGRSDPWRDLHATTGNPGLGRADRPHRLGLTWSRYWVSKLAAVAATLYTAHRDRGAVDPGDGRR